MARHLMVKALLDVRQKRGVVARIVDGAGAKVDRPLMPATPGVVRRVAEHMKDQLEAFALPIVPHSIKGHPQLRVHVKDPPGIVVAWICGRSFKEVGSA